MTCAACVSKVEQILNRFDTVEQAKVNLANQTVIVEGNGPVRFKALKKELQKKLE